MKKMLFLLATTLLLAIQTEGAPALRGTFTVTQPDGTQLTIEQFGDEHHHWTATADGMLVVALKSGYYVAQIDAQGELTPTSVLAHEPAARSSQEQALVAQQQQRRSLFHERGEQATRRALGVAQSGLYLQHSGSPRVLTILAAFQDVSFTINNPAEAFTQYLNGDSQQNLGNYNQMNMGSVRQYFDKSSHGQFAPQFDVVGPITLPREMSYYGKGRSDNMSALCKDSYELAKELVDFSKYDNDGDGNIELVCIIYAGYGENQGGSSDAVWAKASAQNLKTDDGLTITRFNCCCELFHPQFEGYINGTGVFIHELSHCMGLPDLYATSSTGYVNNQGMESWDIMDYGIYNRNGFAPSLYTAWEQEVMGWTEIETITSAVQLSNLAPLEEGGKAYKIVNPDNDRDFLVLENIQQRGFNAYANGHGLLVYHVAYPYSQVNMSDRTNNTPGHPSVAVVPAGGRLISSYLRGTGKTYTNDEWKASIAASAFPGTSGVTTLNDALQLPNYTFYDNDATLAVGRVLSDIREDATGAVSCDVCSPNSVFQLIYLVDGEVYAVYQIPYGSPVNEEALPVKEGYTFSGWDQEPLYMPGHDVTVSGTFSINQYTLTFVIDGDVYSSELVDYGSPITLPEIPDREGYDLVWYNLPATMPAHDVTIQGSYVTGIKAVRQEPTTKEKSYSLDGKQLSSPQRGINVMKGRKVVSAR